MIRELSSLGLLARIVRVGFLPIPSKMVGHGQALPQEVVGTMIEMADVAWNALKHRRKRKAIADEDEEISHLKSENERLKEVLAENLVILHKPSQNSDLAKDCPSDLLKEFPKDLVSLKRVQVFCFYIGRPDLSLNFVEQLYARLEAAVDSSSFLAKLESLHQESNAIPSSYPPRECTDLKEIDLSVNVDGEPCWWIWVSKDMVQDNLEESSGIDNENYVIISEENVGLIGLTGTVIFSCQDHFMLYLKGRSCSSKC